MTARLGRLRIKSLTVDGLAATPTVKDQTILVPLGGILPDGATTTVRIAFSATTRRTLSGSNWLFTRANGVIQLYRWLPWISAARPFNRPNHGDPFVTVNSPSVRVQIHVDRTMRLATSGRRIATNGLTSTWVASDVRDFTVAASPSWTVRTQKVGSTLVRVYAFPGGNGRSLMTLAVRALKRYRTPDGRLSVPDVRRGRERRRVGPRVAGDDLDPARADVRPAPLARQPRGRPPVVLRARRQRPGPPAVRRRGDGRLPRPLHHGHLARRAAARPPRSTGRSIATRRRATSR